MSKPYNSLRPVAFQLNPDTLPYTFNTLTFPLDWARKLQELQAEMPHYSSRFRGIRGKSLNQAVQALVPDLTSITKSSYIFNTGEENRHPWLYSTAMPDLRGIRLVIYHWLDVAFSQVSDDSRQNVLNRLSVDSLSWASQTMDLAQWTIHANNTARPNNSDAFNMIPDWIATKLSQDGVSLQFGATPLTFCRSTLSEGTRGAELVSWPPLSHPDRQGHDCFYSVVLTFTVQTVPFLNVPLIYCGFSIRRWVSHPQTRLGGGSTSIHLLSKVPWLRSFTQSNAQFQVAPIRWYRNEDGSFALKWDSDLPEILNKLQPYQPFPDPNVIVHDPISALNVEGDSHAGIVYSNDMFPDHSVGTGFMPVDRRYLTEKIAELLSPTFSLIPEWHRVKSKISKTKYNNPFFSKLSEEANKTINAQYAVSDFYEQRRQLVQRAVGDTFAIELHYQSSDTLEGLIEHVCNTFGLEEPEELPYQWITPQFSLTLSATRLGNIGAELSLDLSTKDKEKAYRQAIEGRISEIGKHLSHETKPTGALIELGGKKDFAKDTDPKQALRLGFAKTGRNPQFLQLHEKNLAHRVQSAFLDMLRQLGVLPDLPSLTAKDLPQPLNYVGVWLVDSSLPILVHISGDTGQVRGTAPGLTSWISYRELLLAVATKKAMGFSFKERTKIAAFLQEKVQNDVLALGNTLLFCHAQNIRLNWKWLQDSNITIDKIAFGNESPQPITDPTWQGLRVIRVRDSTMSETPEWYAQNKEKVGHTQGIFQIGERVFASTYQKPVQFNKISPSQSKAVATTGSKGSSYQPNPGALSWNPAIYELTLACLQPGDVPKIWAGLAHELRGISLQYNDKTALPLPLHLAKLVDEYW